MTADEAEEVEPKAEATLEEVTVDVVAVAVVTVTVVGATATFAEDIVADMAATVVTPSTLPIPAPSQASAGHKTIVINTR